MADNLHSALREFFGFPSFRAQQEEIVRRAVAGKDTLAVMPTGGGKSLCYQLAAMLRSSPTVVISPLIALMKDQIDNLPAPIAAQACLINSSLDSAEVAERLRGVVGGRYRLVYIAPERLRQRQFIAALRSANIGMIVIDEAHCVSMWGHDFRPDYLFIRSALEALGQPPVLCVTATATPDTANEIGASLGRDLDVIRASVIRPNLRCEVRHVDGEEDRRRRLLETVQASHGSGIIYARSRRKCEEIALLLQRNGTRALHYHAGLEREERTHVQEQFLRDRVRVIVATTAFGMGIDKLDIRWIVLYNYPGSIEDYVQRVGRAGRDGLPSTCTLFAGQSDAANLRRFARSDVPRIERLRLLYACVQRASGGGWVDTTPETLAEESGLTEGEDPRVLVGMLEHAGLVRRDFDAGRAMRIEIMSPPTDSGRRVEMLLDRYARAASDRAERMIGLAGSSRCRHALVAEHFGERLDQPCGMCDVCAPWETATPSTPETRALPVDIASAIVDAVAELPYPVGVRGLAATLHGSVAAPPTAQRSDSFGLLGAVVEGTIQRWVRELLDSGHLDQFENDRGFKLLRVANREGLPTFTAHTYGKRGSAASTAEPEPELTPEELALFESLRGWRTRVAREKSVPAYVVLQDRVLRTIAARRPETVGDLTGIPGLGPVKIEQYGAAILSLLADPATVAG